MDMLESNSIRGCEKKQMEKLCTDSTKIDNLDAECYNAISDN